MMMGSILRVRSTHTRCSDRVPHMLCITEAAVTGRSAVYIGHGFKLISSSLVIQR